MANKYKCERCGKRVSGDRAYQITNFFNGMEIPMKVCYECIVLIGKEGEEDVSEL